MRISDSSLGKCGGRTKKGQAIAYITGGLFGPVSFGTFTLVYMDNITSCVERSCDLLSVA